MHVFDSRFLLEDLPSDLSSATRALVRARERNAARLSADFEGHAFLRSRVMDESTRASSALEGLEVSNGRFQALMAGSQQPLTWCEREIVGYRRALGEILGKDAPLALSENNICHVHRLLKGKGTEGAGRYKQSDNWVRERDLSRGTHVAFIPTAAADTPHAMAELVRTYQQAKRNPQINPLALVSQTVIDFLCVYPFDDGNERLSRLITSWLLEDLSFDVPRYASIEGVFLGRRHEYWEALRASFAGWHENRCDYLPFMRFLVMVLWECYQDVNVRYLGATMRERPKAKRVEALLMSADRPITRSEILRRLPEVSPQTVRNVLLALQKAKMIEKLGTYRNARYQRAEHVQGMP